LDILFHASGAHLCDRLTIPHPRYAERAFVLAPLADLEGAATTADATSVGLRHAREHWRLMGESRAMEKEDIVRVMPLKNKLWSWGASTAVMGILNITPDSFSDGGKFSASVDAAITLERWSPQERQS